MVIIANETEQNSIDDDEEEEGPWKNVSHDILALILKHFHKKPELCRFRSICQSWRSFATPIQSHFLFPLILPPFNPNSRYFSLSPTFLYIFSPLHNNPTNNFWLSKVAETGDNKWALLNPLTKHKLYFFSPRVFKHGINLLGFRNQEVGRSYRLQLISDFGVEEEEDTFDFEGFSSSISLTKVVVQIEESRVSVLGLFGYGEVAIWRSGDQKWKIIETGKKEKKYDFDDVICYGGRFYAVEQTGRLMMINPTAIEAVTPITSSSSSSSSVEEEEEEELKYRYLVECDNRLYMVNKIVNPRPTNYYDEEEEEWVVDKRSAGKALGFKVYVLNEKQKRWEEVRSLGKKVVFVSRDASFAVNAEELGWKKGGNCIYFEGLTGYDDEADMSFGLNAGVYTLEDDAIFTFHLGMMDSWTRIFWPPATWFQDHQLPSI